LGVFTWGNGARLERINTMADLSQRGLREAHGMMVNYLYRLDAIGANHEVFVAQDKVVASEEVQYWLPEARHSQEQQNSPERATA
jgi:malonyl-CoA decarboxylase